MFEKENGKVTLEYSRYFQMLPVAPRAPKTLLSSSQLGAVMPRAACGTLLVTFKISSIEAKGYTTLPTCCYCGNQLKN